MRRYGVRILVAVLTFLLGVAFSFGFGLFRVRETRHKSHKSHWSWSDCPKRSVEKTYQHPFTVYNSETAPLRLTFLGPTLETVNQREQMLRVLVENVSRQTVSGYSLAGERSWRYNRDGEFINLKHALLRPGQSEMNLVPNNSERRVDLWLSHVQFQDGSIWNNPRSLR